MLISNSNKFIPTDLPKFKSGIRPKININLYNTNSMDIVSYRCKTEIEYFNYKFLL